MPILSKARTTLAYQGRATMAGVMLIVLVVLGSATVSGFWSLESLRANLLIASFLGIATIGQALCALIGGLDLSIAFVVGAANIALLRLMDGGIPVGFSIVIVLILAAAVGGLSGVISSNLRGATLVVTLGVGTALLGLVQILVSSSGVSGGTVEGNVPGWMQGLTSLDSPIGIAPCVIVWAVLAALTILFLRRTWIGRGLYAMGGNQVAAERALVPTRALWVFVFSVSAVMAAVAGMILLGFTGGGYSGVGDPYLFTTIAAVLIGGTSLVGGRGGYGLTVLGVLDLTVLQTILSGFSLSAAAQEAILGLLILPLAALYVRSPHPRMEI
jgi:ribose transport system permease protein